MNIKILGNYNDLFKPLKLSVEQLNRFKDYISYIFVNE